MPIRIYLAGPDVFYPHPMMESMRLKKICTAHRLEGVFPMDAEIDISSMTKHEAARAIYEANIELIQSCNGIMANMEAFRGPSMDGGTAFEMGYAKALGLPIVGYNTKGTYLERCRAIYGELSIKDGHEVDPNGLSVEDFDLPDNLMMSCGADKIVKTADDAAIALKHLCAADE